MAEDKYYDEAAREHWSGLRKAMKAQMSRRVALKGSTVLAPGGMAALTEYLVGWRRR